MRKKGAVLITVLMLSMFLMILSVSITSLSAGNFDIVSSVKKRAKASNAAEAGIAMALYEVNSYSGWINSEDPDFDTSEPLTAVLDDENTTFTVRLVNNLNSKSKKVSPINGEVIPPLSAQLVSTGKAGPDSPESEENPDQRKISKTVVCILRMSYMQAYAAASSGQIDSVNGDFTVDGIDSITTWNEIPGNIHSNLTYGDTSFQWNGAGIHNCNISGKITTSNSTESVKFLGAPGGFEAPEIVDYTSVSFPEPVAGMEPPMNFDSLPDISEVEPDEDGNIILTGGSWKYDGNKEEDLIIAVDDEGNGGKLILDNARLYVKDGNIEIQGGLSGSGIVSATGNKDVDEFELWKYSSTEYKGTEWKLESSEWHPDPPDDDDDDSGFQDTNLFLASQNKKPASNRILTLGDGQLSASSGLITSDFSMDIAWEPGPSYEDYPPGTTIDDVPTSQTNVCEVRYEDNYKTRTWREDVPGGYWIHTEREYRVYHVIERKHKYNIKQSSGITIKGENDFNSENIAGTLLYSEGIIKVEGTENEKKVYRLLDLLKTRILNDIENEENNIHLGTLTADYFKNDMIITDGGVEYPFTKIEEYLNNHPALKFKSLGEITADNGQIFLTAISQHLCDYNYFQGIIYSRSGFEATGKAKILGGVLVKCDDINYQEVAGIFLDGGATLTCNGEYLRVFETYYKDPIYSTTSWHELD